MNPRVLEIVEQRKRAVLNTLDRARISYSVTNHEVRILCPSPSCQGHSRKTLYINYVRLVGWCHRCEQSFTWKYLCRLLELYHGIVADQVSLTTPTVEELRTSLRAVLGAPLIAKAHREVLPEVPLPFGAIPAYRSRRALQYCMSRGLTVEHLIDHHIMWCSYGPLRSRVIFPLFWDKKCVGWTSRHVNNEHPKYRHSPGFPGAQLLYPQENLQNARLIVTEGVIPALLFRGVATFGKYLHDAQRRLLCQEHVKQVVLLYDRDAWKGTRATALRAWRQLAAVVTTIGLILPEESPQPDDFYVSTLGGSIERAAGKSTESSIWRVFADGTLRKIM